MLHDLQEFKSDKSSSDVGELVRILSGLPKAKARKLGQVLCPDVQQLKSVESILQCWLKNDPAPTRKKLEEALKQIEGEKK